MFQINLDKIEFTIFDGAKQTSRAVMYLYKFPEKNPEISFTFEEKQGLEDFHKDAAILIQQINPMIYYRLANNNTLKSMIKKYHMNTGSFEARNRIVGLIQNITDKYNREMIALKKPDAVRKRELEKRELIMFIKKNIDGFHALFELFNKISKIRDMIDGKR